MKTTKLLPLILLLLGISSKLIAGDVYAEYKMTGMGNKINTSKLYLKDGDLRSEVNMEISGKEMFTVTLKLKSNPGVTIVYNSQSKTYNEIKSDPNSSKDKEITVTVLGNEKIGSYNCKHVRMTSDEKSWDMWVTKDLPRFDFPIENNNEAANHKIYELMKSKDVDGMLVKLEFYKPGTTTASMTMELQKYENKDLDENLFKIPAGYTKSTVQFDAEKIKAMTPEERQEMIKKMMDENQPQK